MVSGTIIAYVAARLYAKSNITHCLMNFPCFSEESLISSFIESRTLNRLIYFPTNSYLCFLCTKPSVVEAMDVCIFWGSVNTLEAGLENLSILVVAAKLTPPKQLW